MAIDVGTAVVYLNMDIENFNANIKQAESALSSFSNYGSKISTIGNTLSSFGADMTRYVTTPLVNLGQSSIQAFRDYESAFTGVKKTIDEIDLINTFGNIETGYEVLSANIQKMTQETASSAEEIAGVMEIAGQLGVPLGQAGDDITEFTKVMIMLGDTTNVTAAEAADALARFMNITGTSFSDVDRLGSTIVHLGNNFATTESEIINMSTRMASAATMAGLTEQEILALATAISSAGIRAEAGGSAISTTFTKVETIVEGVAENSEEKLQAIADATGMTAEEFAEAWRNKPLEAITALLAGMANMEEEGGSAIVLLDELGMTGVRQSNLLKALALSMDNVSRAVDYANEGWEENTALSREAELRYSTLDSEIIQLEEEWKDLKRELAVELIPILRDLMDILRELIGWWKGLTDEQKEGIVKFLEFIAIVGPALTIIGKLITTFGTLWSIITNISSALSSAGTAVTSFLGVLGAIASVIAGVVLFFTNFISLLQKGWDWLKYILMILGDILAVVGLIALGVSAWPAIIIGAVVAAIATVIILVVNFWEEISTFFKNRWEDVKKFFSEAWETIKGWFNQAKEFVQKMLDDQVNSITTLLKNIQEAVSKAIDTIRKWLEDFGNNAKEWFTNLANGLTEAITKIINWLSEKGAELYNNVSNFFENLWSMITSKFNEVVEIVSNFFINIFNNLNENFQKIKETVGNFFERAKSTLSGWFESLQETIGNLIQNLLAKLTEVYSQVVEVVTNLLDTIGSLIGGFIETIKTIFSGISDVLNQMVSFIGDLVQKITESIGNIVQTFTETVQGIWQNLTSTIADTFQDIYDNITNKVAKIIEKVRGLLPKFLEAGQDMIKNVWEGMKKTFTDLISWVEEKIDYIRNLISNANFFQNIGSTVTGWFNGSHANGLDYVPFNGYVAQLHEGERVLTKQEARDYNNGMNSGSQNTINIYSYEKLDEYNAAKEMKKALKTMDMGF